MLPHKFYPIVNDVSWIERLLPVGVKFIQYRNKKQDESVVRPQIQKALQLGKEYDAVIVINDYWRIAIEEEAEWIHLGQEDLQTVDKAAIKNAGLKLGTSTHNHEELDYALSFEPDYVALGPIYNTISKDMVFAPQGLEKVTEWKKRVGGLPLVGLGGVRAEKAQDVLDAGADAVACIGDITMNANPEERAKKWIKTVSQNSTAAKSAA